MEGEPSKPCPLLPAPSPEEPPVPLGPDRGQADIERLQDRVRSLQAKVDRDREHLKLWQEFQPKFTEFLADLLEVLDNFERAENAALAGGPLQAVAEGLTAVRRQMLAALERREIRPFDPVGQEFDPRLHLILDAPPGESVPPLWVAEVLRPGYKIGDQVLRKAWVRVQEDPP
jgi:molecular chaperone GrpE